MLEIADILRAAGAAYREKFGSHMRPSHKKAMRDLERCRTSALGGHLRECDHCGERCYTYHSCRNRHCPKCEGDRTRRWLDVQQARLLPCPYFLLTFTLPSELRDLARSNQRSIYGILMTAAAQALQALAADPRYLGARPGMIGVLHTWTRAMVYHPHVHLLVTAGGLTSDGKNWKDTKNPSFLVPCRALAVIFRAKVRDALERAGLQTAELPRKVWHRKWVVHCQHAGTGYKVLEYLGRYLYRVAIANSRLERFEDNLVTFHYRDSETGVIRRCTLDAEAFISRFLQHVLPRNFAKVRSCGLFSPTCKPALERARSLLEAPSEGDSQTNPQRTTFEKRALSDHEPHAPDPLCPRCALGHLRIVAILPRALTSMLLAAARAPP